MTRVQTTVRLMVVVMASASLSAQSDQAQRIGYATTVLQEIMAAPDQAIPSSVLDKAEAIAVFPSVIKGGFVVSAQRGKGVISVRDRASNTWSLPAFLSVTGGGFGAQIGAQSTDLVLVVMNRRGLDNLLRNQFTVGAGAEVAAGPVGRAAAAATDIQMRAQILSYSRTRGLFAGVSLRGAAIRQDRDSNEDYYGAPHSTRAIVLDRRATAPRGAEELDAWFSSLTKYVR